LKRIIRYPDLLDRIFTYLLEKPDFDTLIELHKEFARRSSASHHYRNEILNLRIPEFDVLFDFYKQLPDDMREDVFRKILGVYEALGEDFLKREWLRGLLNKVESDFMAKSALLACIPAEGKNKKTVNGEFSLTPDEKLKLIDFLVENNRFDALYDYRDEIRKINDFEKQKEYARKFIEYVNRIPESQKRNFDELVRQKDFLDGKI